MKFTIVVIFKFIFSLFFSVLSSNTGCFQFFEFGTRNCTQNLTCVVITRDSYQEHNYSQIFQKKQINASKMITIIKNEESINYVSLNSSDYSSSNEFTIYQKLTNSSCSNGSTKQYNILLTVNTINSFSYCSLHQNVVYFGFNYTASECSSETSLSSTQTSTVKINTHSSLTTSRHSITISNNTTTVNHTSIVYEQTQLFSTTSINQSNSSLSQELNMGIQWYTIECKMNKTRYNQFNNSQIETLIVEIIDIGLCDLLVRNYTALKMMIYKNKTATEVMRIQANMKNRLKQIEVEYSLVIKSSKSFAYLVIIAIFLIFLRFIFDDLINILKYFYRKHHIHLERKKNLAKKNYSLPKNESNICELSDFRKVTHLDLILYEKSNQLKNKIKLKDSVV
jgi:hypothetical protein